jgi:hypothetical protein
MGTVGKVLIGVVVTGAVVGGGVMAFRWWRRRRPVAAAPAAAMAAQMPAAVVAGMPMSPRVMAKKRGGSRFSRFGLKALRTGLRAGSIAGVPGTSVARELAG